MLQTRPVLSLNRGFSAPVILQENVSPEDQLFLMGRDKDTFNRWEAGQSLGKSSYHRKPCSASRQAPATATKGYADALQKHARRHNA